jgi:hypothetical protein
MKEYKVKSKNGEVNIPKKVYLDLNIKLVPLDEGAELALQGVDEDRKLTLKALKEQKTA